MVVLLKLPNSKVEDNQIIQIDMEYRIKYFENSLYLKKIENVFFFILVTKYLTIS